MAKVVSTSEQIEGQHHVSFILPTENPSSRTPSVTSVTSVTSVNCTLKQPRYHNLYQPSWREQLAVKLDNSKVGSIWKLVDAFINIMLCVIYISNTAYMKVALPPFNVICESSLVILLLLEYIPKFYIYKFESWHSLFTGVSPILTALTIYPVFITALDPVLNETRYIVFFYPFRFIRCYFSVYDCLVRSEKSVLKIGQVTSRVLIFLESILFLVLASSSLLYGVEYAYMEAKDLTFLDALFFTTIMLGTVGYLSDIIPDNAFPRVLLMVIFILGLIFIPYSITELTSLIRSKSIYDKPFRKISKQPHVIIIAPTIELPSLRHFLKEFYSLAHGTATVNTKVVILNSTDPTERVKTFLSDPVFAHRVQYIRGSPLEARYLEKSKAANASAYFILAKKYTQQSEIIDAENVLRAIALRKFNVGPKFYIQCILPENKVHFESLNPEQIICIDELKLGILAHSCLTPGFSSLLYGLTTSFVSESKQQLRNEAKKHCSSNVLDIEAIEDYIAGVSHSIYTTTLSECFHGQTFLVVSERLFESLGVVLFAIGIPKQRSTSKYTNHWVFDCNDLDEEEYSKNYTVLINPGDYIVKGDEIGFIIASSDGKLADGISTCELHSQRHDVISHYEPPAFSERQPLLSGDTLKNGGGGSYFDIKKKPQTTPDQQYHEYPHRPDSSISRRQRALSTPLSLSTDHPHENPHHDHPITSLNTSSHVHEIENSCSIVETITGHILLCDYSSIFPRNLDCFVSPLRKSHLDKITPVVILSPARPSRSQWKILSRFDHVYFVEGNPMTREGLESGRVRYAKQAVILTDSTRILRNGEKTEDASSMLVFLNIKAMCKEDIDVFVEFVHMDNMKFMSEDASSIDINMKPHHSPAFMAGTCFSLSMLDSIICQSFYQPHLVSIIHQMLFGAPPLHLPSGATCPAPSHSHFFQIPVPHAFVGYQYGALFHFLSNEKKAIPLGLYRTKSVKTSNGNMKDVKYIYICPEYHSLLKETDKVFVLSKRMPIISEKA
ncbi:hypothetical protein Glove_327g8 [Diversispora epigaea]|uniref:Calcium-activated potassium channel BK alpha subunit domain-containing protein n=1 Tax=Diversispora epigaea TaxID=1348612 RepID=A0A397HLC3_9GLOM|nr:hypothetical protein Glove_327g8 [Diversispora epigaea]